MTSWAGVTGRRWSGVLLLALTLLLSGAGAGHHHHHDAHPPLEDTTCVFCATALTPALPAADLSLPAPAIGLHADPPHRRALLPGSPPRDDGLPRGPPGPVA